MEKIKVVITGGPSGGKTTLVEILQKDFHTKLSIVPEAASILYRGGFPRRPSAVGKIHAQRAICFVQRELEDLITEESKTDLLVCDRGSLDSIAYWPGDEDDFFQSLRTTRETEFKRYQWVLHLDTADPNSFDGDNPVRIENYKEAHELNAMIKEAWAGHPQRIIISNSENFMEKMSLGKKIINLILQGRDYKGILKEIGK